MRSDADIFVPEGRLRGDEVGHEVDAFLIVPYLDGNAGLMQNIFRAQERLVFANDDASDAVKKNCARTHRAR